MRKAPKAKTNGNGLPKDQFYTLGGRRFVLSARSSFRQDARMLELAEVTGLSSFLVSVASSPGKEVDPEVARKILVTAYTKGTLFDMMATALVPEGQAKWTVESAKEIAEHLAELSDPEDKKQLEQIILGVILGFFVAVRSALDASRSSAATTSGPGLTIPSTAAPTGEASPVDRGPGSSEPSPAMSPSTTTPSATGT